MADQGGVRKFQTHCRLAVLGDDDDDDDDDEGRITLSKSDRATRARTTSSSTLANRRVPPSVQRQAAIWDSPWVLRVGVDWCRGSSVRSSVFW